VNARSSTQPPPPNFAGTWFTNFALVTINQDGTRVTGSYVRYGEGSSVSLQGTINRNVLEGYAESGSERSSLKFVLNERGNFFEGYWAGWRGEHQWCGVRSGSLPSGCGFSGRWSLYGEAMPTNAWADLVQTGDRVAGSYSNGTVEGKVKAWSLAGKWDTGNQGTFTWWFVDLKTDQFRGNWDGDQQWCGSRRGGMPDPCLQQ
jgi:hypothetical protein